MLWVLVLLGGRFPRSRGEPAFRLRLQSESGAPRKLACVRALLGSFKNTIDTLSQI